jgi:hypothetical protein
MHWLHSKVILEQRRRLAESEQKRLIALEQMLTAEQAMALVHRVVDIVGRHVRDREAMSAIVVELRALAEVTSGRPVYGEAPDA